MTIGTMEPMLVPDWKSAHHWATIWVAGFWGAVGIGIILAPIFITMGNIWWTGPLLLLAGISTAIARVTNQPGA